jgi:hypothetical protein
MCPFLRKVDISQDNLQELEKSLKLNFDESMTSTIQVSFGLLEEPQPDELKRSKTKEYKASKHL